MNALFIGLLFIVALGASIVVADLIAAVSVHVLPSRRAELRGTIHRGCSR